MKHITGMIFFGMFAVIASVICFYTKENTIGWVLMPIGILGIIATVCVLLYNKKLDKIEQAEKEKTIEQYNKTHATVVFEINTIKKSKVQDFLKSHSKDVERKRYPFKIELHPVQKESFFVAVALDNEKIGDIVDVDADLFKLYTGKYTIVNESYNPEEDICFLYPQIIIKNEFDDDGNMTYKAYIEMMFSSKSGFGDDLIE